MKNNNKLEYNKTKECEILIFGDVATLALGL